MSVLWFDAAQRWHKFPGQNQVRVAGGRLILHEKDVLRASDVYTGRQLWEFDLSDESLDRQGIRRIHAPRPLAHQTASATPAVPARIAGGDRASLTAR